MVASTAKGEGAVLYHHQYQYHHQKKRKRRRRLTDCCIDCRRRRSDIVKNKDLCYHQYHHQYHQYHNQKERKRRRRLTDCCIDCRRSGIVVNKDPCCRFLPLNSFHQHCTTLTSSSLLISAFHGLMAE